MSNFKVLIADDDEGMRLVLKKIVDKVPGFQVTSVTDNGADALKLFKKEKPDVVFLDVEMPGWTASNAARL